MARTFATGRRRWLLVAGGIVVLLFVFLNVMSGFYVDLLWFRELGFTGVFWTVFWSRVLLGVIFGVLFFLLLLANLLIVRRLSPPYRVLSPDQEVIERYRVAVEPYVKWILPGVSALIALFVGIGASVQWQSFLLWRHSGGELFGVTDPVYGRDVAFYVFKLPFLHFVQGWLFSALVGIAVIVTVAHYLWGGIRLQAPGERFTPQVKAHLSVLLGLIVLVKAWGYYLGRFDLLFSDRGVVTGASYTDINAQKPALTLLMFIAIACAVIFFVNIRFRGWAFPAIALGLLALTAVVAGAIFPAAIQRFSVAPQEFQREQQFIERNIEFTRRAFDLDQIASVPRGVDTDISSEDVENSPGTIQNIRLWDPLLLQQNYDVLQRLRQYYEFEDVDVDRYLLDGEQRMVMASAREVSQSAIGEGSSWQTRHLVYTHGFGAVASEVSTATSEGQPEFLLKDIPVEAEASIPLSQPRVYYGELEDVPFVVVNAGGTPPLDELDFQGTAENENDQETFRYDGQGGIRVGGFFGKMLFAWRYKDVNLLISGLITDESKVLIYRDIEDRIPKPAPFLKYDGDPYLAIVDGRMVWIQDAYTATNFYPYSDRISLSTVTGRNLTGDANYIRNSVKVVVDAYDGTVTYYVVDEEDPIIRVWRNAFPDLFSDEATVSEDLRAHFRYPEDLFTIQAQQFSQYHVTDPTVFYQGQDFWAVPTDPAAGAEGTQNLRPYYVLMRLPPKAGDTPEPGLEEEFVLIQPFTPAERTNMIAWIAARSDPEGYGEVLSYEFGARGDINGPVQVFNRINNDRRFSSERTLLGQGGSEVLFGNFLVIPLQRVAEEGAETTRDAFLYVQPVFVRSNQANAFPELKRVVVVHGGVVGIGDTLEEALADSFGQEPPPDGEPEPPPPGGTVDEQVRALLAEAVRHFELAQAALEAGDLGTYQEEIELAEDLIRQADELIAESEGVTPAPTPTATVEPTPTATATVSG